MNEVFVALHTRCNITSFCITFKTSRLDANTGPRNQKLPNRLASQPTNKKAMRTLRKKRVSTCKKRLVSCALHRVARNVQLTGEILAQRDARFASLSCQFSSLSSESSLPCSWLDAAWRRERSLRLRSSAVRARQPCTVRV